MNEAKEFAGNPKAKASSAGVPRQASPWEHSQSCNLVGQEV